ncbi:MAG: glycosyltransferase family 39 protein [Candidatus Eisenbacteria bacterium]|nr:glycosyltransferase family 39 protein [Candidatus Eisenbacteria bacterium]
MNSSPAPARKALPRPVVWVLAASLALGLFVAFAYPLVDPDEGRNAQVAAEMAANGDVVIPHLSGVPYLDKPPALFALSAAAIRVFGPQPFAARLPAILAALLTLLMLAHASRRLAPEGHAFRVTALTAASPLFAVIGAYVIFDMPLAACVTAVWTLLAIELEHGVSAKRRLLMFLAVGLGVLVKGPVMLAWTFGGSLGAAVLLRSTSALAWLGWWPGWLVALGLPGAWFAAALQRHPEYAHYAFLEETFERMTSSSFHRNQPWWFVPAVFVGGALPWSLGTPWRAPASPASRVAAGFALFAAVFFSLSHSKLVTYLLPAFPALAWWAAESWSAQPRPRAVFAAMLAFAPLVLVAGWISLRPVAAHTSGEGLARAVQAAGAPALRYEDCYSPGTDFLLGRRSPVVSALGHPLTSNYAVRYRESLRERGLWTLLDSPADAPPARIIVREPSHAGVPPAGAREIFRDARFIAWLLPAD